MGRWAQRRRAGTAHPAVNEARILSVTRSTDNSFADVHFDSTVTSADTGVGNLTIDEGGSPESAAIDSLQSPTVVRYGGYDPISLGQAWTLDDASGLHFAGGKALATPATGVIT